MEKPRPCGCKGIRTCLICEKEYGISKKVGEELKDKDSYVYCPFCNKAWPGWDLSSYKTHPVHDGHPLSFPGIFIEPDFLSTDEEEYLMKGIDEMPWDASQSGRRKQNFGPKCNFKKKRLKVGNFKGFPAFSKFVQEKFEDFPILKGYKTIEQCSLEYDPKRGASIDPHIDDCWVWGERIVTVNLLTDSILTMTPYTGDTKRYNLSDIETYPVVLDEKGNSISESGKSVHFQAVLPKEMQNKVVRVPMPHRSLMVLYGPARYLWEHAVLRQDITERRVCLAYREFTPVYLSGGKYANISQEILNKAKNFWNHVEEKSNLSTM